MKLNLLFIAIICSTTIFIGCKEKGNDKILTKEVVFTKEGELSLIKSENDSLLAKIDIEIADDDYQTQTGLMYRKSMLNSRGMLFVFEDNIRRSFYMKNTEFALDIYFINSENKIIKIYRNTTPLDESSLPSEAPCQYVLEVSAGQTDTWNLNEGDRIEWVRIN